MLTEEQLLGIEKTLLTRTEFELCRKEKHSNVRLIDNSEYTTEQFLDAFNRAKCGIISKRDEDKRNEDIPEFKIRKLYFALTWIIVYVGVFSATLLRMYQVNGIDVFKETSTIIMLVALALFLALPTLAIAYAFKFLGMPPFNAFLRSDTKFYKMDNGQIAFADLCESSYPYPSVFDNEEVLHKPTWKSSNMLNTRETRIIEVYVPTKIISAKMTRNGILLESSGRFYGVRTSCVIRIGHNHSSGFRFEDWSEMDIDYRKEVIPVTWTNLEGLLRELQTYDNGIIEKPFRID